MAERVHALTGNHLPPSTLAAQLVENISTSASSARSDENHELQGLFALIQGVKDNPETLRIPEERIRHNHMLIYVYCRVALEAIRLDDPFMNRASVNAELLKAINFLRFTVKETPNVLRVTGQNCDFMHRGSEPLWMWLLPHVLRFLGHAEFLELQEAIQGFLCYLVLVVARNDSLWGLSDSLFLYIRACMAGILNHLQDPSLNPSQQALPASLWLPPSFALEQLLGGPLERHSQRTSFAITSASQALRQVSSLAQILAHPFTSQESSFSCISSAFQSAVWLMDAWLDMRQVQIRWQAVVKNSPIPLIELALSVAQSSLGNSDLAACLGNKAYVLLVLLCSEIISCPADLVRLDTAGKQSRLVYCKALVAIAEASLHSHVIGRLAASKLVHELRLLSPQHASIGQGTDVWKCTTLLYHIIYTREDAIQDKDLNPSEIEDAELRSSFEKLGFLRQASTAVTVNEVKKRKLSVQNTEGHHELLQAIRELLGPVNNVEANSSSFEQMFLAGFEKATEQQQCDAIELLSRLCCAADESMSTSDSINSQYATLCAICDDENSTAQKLDSNAVKAEARMIFTKLIQTPSFLQSKRPRVIAMLALRRLVLHCESQSFLDLDKRGSGDHMESSAGHWCLQSLIKSSVRELRVAAGRTLSTYLSQNLGGFEELLFERNREYCIAVLKETSKKNEPHLMETRIMAWGQLGRHVSDDELNVVLLKLLEYLGSNNSIVSAFAFNELLRLSEARSTTPRRLFEPFWKSLAYMAIKDMVHRPQQSRVIAELLQISINELLLLIQSHALPWLVLDKRLDVIQKIAEARGEQETWRSLTDGSNLASILALLLVQDVDDVGSFTEARLNDISPHFHHLSLADLFLSEPVMIAIELLRAAAEADETRHKVIHKALNFVATTILKSNKDIKYKKGAAVGKFLQSHVLGLMARLTDVINGSVPPHEPMLQQRSCIRAMEEMIKVCKTYVRIARPQISACLLSAISHHALRAASFSCWAAMLTNLGQEDVEALIETTFYLISRYWSTFNEATARVAEETINFLLDKNKTIVKAYISRLPSLTHITELAQAEQRLAKMRPALSTDEALNVFAKRISHDNSGVVYLALNELISYLRENLGALCTLAMGQRPDSSLSHIMRSLLDCACKYNGINTEISRFCVESLGLIGCLDANQIEAVREHRSIVVLNNFQKAGEMTDFGLFLLQEVLVPSFLSAADTKLQGFLSFAMQELLTRCGVKEVCAMQDNGAVGDNDIYKKWIALPENIREVLTPFLSSRYMVAPMPPVNVEYPIFHPGKPYGNWLRSFVIDLLRRGQGEYAEALFEPLKRVIRIKDLSAAEFLLPYLALHVMIGTKSSQSEGSLVIEELMGILKHRPPEGAMYQEKEEMKKFCHAVFRVLDYAMRWVHAKRSEGDWRLIKKETVSSIQRLIDQIPAELVSERARDCNEYARALFHLEQHASKVDQQKSKPEDRNRLLERLRDIYANIDEPDGLEGISAHLHALDLNQQILGHKKAGRWTAAQTWYEMKLAEKPQEVEARLDLLTCLKQAGQHDALLNHVGGMQADAASDNKIMPFAVEASWVTGRWDALVNFSHRFHGSVVEDFNISIAALLESLYVRSDSEMLAGTIGRIRDNIASEMTMSTTGSLQAAHDVLLKCHALADLEMIVASKPQDDAEKRQAMELLDNRLNVIGAYFQDKQYLLGIRRATMELRRPYFGDGDVSRLWLTSARIARKTNSLHESFNAVLHALRLEDEVGPIENAKLLWREKQHRKAIQVLQGAIEHMRLKKAKRSVASSAASDSPTAQQKMVTARAQLLLAKWLDSSGQSHAGALREKYQQPPKTFPTWEKGHYYLGRHYKKILESEQPLKSDDQSDNYVTGEIARLVIENYVRSLNCGTKYLHQTLPRILTLWLELGAQVDKAPDGKALLSRELYKRRIEQVSMLHSFLDKYIHRLPGYIFYTALSQIVARIAHPNVNVFERLTQIIVKVVEAHPRQALWSLIGIMTTRQTSERKARGAQVLQAVRGIGRKGEGGSGEVKQLVRAGERLAEQLLAACHNGDFQGSKTVQARLGRDLGFQHKCTPCPLVVPVEAWLTAALPRVSEQVKKHQAFAREVVTIDCFLDEVLVLSSLAKPRRLTARGSDGHKYMLLIKPKDDLRTDQRLMEFNAIINGSLKRDVETSRRQLYIRTYAVVPLNEECGIIEWVPGIRTMRDIILGEYAARKIYPDYQVLKQLMDEAAACDSKLGLFSEQVLAKCPAVLPAWFVQQFPSPAAWFAARLRYTRSCAVMSMVGTILGLGDRHGENVNLEEGSGGVLHVDFNCLFDKGKTFAKPERVPFRLTQNMVAAMGIYAYEGPFRKSCELTLAILRQHDETLMTILEAFIYDPTLDLQRDKRAARTSTLQLQPQAVLDSIKRKVRGLLPDESIPLSIEGQVDELIKQATDARNLTAMYIGWCPFF
ncbi:hypothetical protein CDD81_3120 [Ophiocordyceps australis]|uniref:Serine/threonine-protein kinase MEC1 n=1 Tax=Ophiocordyceps australis TaxID=1399860 RepID=A0A2C5YEG1_9HYPO|nr:hypothetical protein CDD81_3120 [Ophiocordyceps australis]